MFPVNIMVTIKIGESEMEFDRISSVDENWIIQNVNRRRQDFKTVCVRVTLHTDAVSIILIGGECIGGGGGSARRLTQEEEDALELWEKLGLKGSRVDAGKLVGFFKQVRRIAE